MYEYIKKHIKLYIIIIYIINIPKISFSYNFDDFTDYDNNYIKYFYKKRGNNTKNNFSYIDIEEIKSLKEKQKNKKKNKNQQNDKILETTFKLNGFSIFYTNQTSLMNYKLKIVNTYKISELNFINKYHSNIGFEYWHRMKYKNIILGLFTQYTIQTPLEKSKVEDKDFMNYDYRVSDYSVGGGDNFKFINTKLFLKHILMETNNNVGYFQFMTNYGINFTYITMDDKNSKYWYNSGYTTGIFPKSGLQYTQILLLPYFGFTINYEFGIIFLNLQANISFLNFAYQKDYHKLRTDVSNQKSKFINFLFFNYDAEFTIGFKIKKNVKLFVSTGIFQTLDTPSRIGKIFDNKSGMFEYENESMNNLINYIKAGITLEI